MLTANNKQTILRDVNIARHIKKQKKTRENLFHRYNPHGKSFQTGIVPVTRNSHPLPRLRINCLRQVNTNHAIKIKHFHMLCTKYSLSW